MCKLNLNTQKFFVNLKDKIIVANADDFKRLGFYYVNRKTEIENIKKQIPFLDDEKLKQMNNHLTLLLKVKDSILFRSLKDGLYVIKSIAPDSFELKKKELEKIVETRRKKTELYEENEENEDEFYGHENGWVETRTYDDGETFVLQLDGMLYRNEPGKAEEDGAKKFDNFTEAFKYAFIQEPVREKIGFYDSKTKREKLIELGNKWQRELLDTFDCDEDGNLMIKLCLFDKTEFRSFSTEILNFKSGEKTSNLEVKNCMSALLFLQKSITEELRDLVNHRLEK